MKRMILFQVFMLIASIAGASLTWNHVTAKDVFFTTNDGVKVVRVFVRVLSSNPAVHPAQAFKVFTLKQSDVCKADGTVDETKLMAAVQNDPAFSAIKAADGGFLLKKPSKSKIKK